MFKTIYIIFRAFGRLSYAFLSQKTVLLLSMLSFFTSDYHNSFTTFFVIPFGICCYICNIKFESDMSKIDKILNINEKSKLNIQTKSLKSRIKRLIPR